MTEEAVDLSEVEVQRFANDQIGSDVSPAVKKFWK